MAQKFELVSDFKPMGDQPQAIELLARWPEAGATLSNSAGSDGHGQEPRTQRECVCR